MNSFAEITNGSFFRPGIMHERFTGIQSADCICAVHNDDLVLLRDTATKHNQGQAEPSLLKLIPQQYIY